MGRGPSIAGRKNAADAEKAKKFTKFIREITIAARVGGGDPNANPRLRLAIDRALTANMTKDTVERAIKRGSGEGGEAQVEIRYEGYGPGGVAVIVTAPGVPPGRESSAIVPLPAPSTLACHATVVSPPGSRSVTPATATTASARCCSTSRRAPTSSW